MKKTICLFFIAALITQSGFGQNTSYGESRFSNQSLVVEKLDPEKGEMSRLAKELGLNLYKSNFGVIASNSDEIAELIAREWFRSFVQFKEVFEKDLGNGLVIDGFSLGLKGQQMLRELGLKWQFVWPASVISDGELGSNVIKDINDSHSQNNAISHELGHLYLINAYNWTGPSDGYGSSAPDWFDEAIAISMENQYLTESRREDFRKTEPYSLKELLTTKHPGVNMKANKELVDQINKMRSERSGKAMMAGKIKVENAEILSNVSRFYSNVRVFLDYLNQVDESGNVLKSLAEWFEEGRNIEDWLQQKGSRYSLVENVEELNEVWLEWIEVKKLRK